MTNMHIYIYIYISFSVYQNKNYKRKKVVECDNGMGKIRSVHQHGGGSGKGCATNHIIVGFTFIIRPLL